MDAADFERRIRHYEQMAQVCSHSEDRERFRSLADDLRHQLFAQVASRIRAPRAH